MSALPLLQDTAENCRKEERGYFQPGSPGKTPQRKNVFDLGHSSELVKKGGSSGMWEETRSLVL